MKSEPVAIVAFESWLPPSYSLPFIARASDETRWVVKAAWTEHRLKSLFNEWIVGNLARSVGIPWPEVRLCTYSVKPSDFPPNPGLSEAMPPCVSEFGIALRFIDGLQMLDWPERPEADWDDIKSWREPALAKKAREKVDREILGPYLNDQNIQLLAGMAVFTNWAMSGDEKVDVLNLTSDGRFLLMDGSCYLGGRSWDPLLEEDFLQKSRFHMNARGHLDFTRVLLQPDGQLFEPWLARIASFASGDLDAILEQVPQCWNTPEEGIRKVRAALVDQRDEFIQAYRDLLEGWKLEVEHGWGPLDPDDFPE